MVMSDELKMCVYHVAMEDGLPEIAKMYYVEGWKEPRRRSNGWRVSIWRNRDVF
jgi:hypothetical protein